jgi:hypothetical protein
MEEQARASLDAVNKEWEKFSAKQLKDWQKQAKKMRGITTKELLASIEDIITGTGPKAEVFAEEFANAIRASFESSDALRSTIASFQQRFQQMLRPEERGGAPEGAPIREVLATMKARLAQLMEWEEEQRASVEQRKGELRVERLEEALDTIHERVMQGLNKEVALVRSTMEKLTQIRETAFSKILQTRESMLRKAASTEQAIWEIERGDPSLSEQERWDKTYDRVKEIIEEAKELASSGHEELAKERLDQAAGLATQLASGDERSYGIRAQLAKDFLEDIQKEFDALAEAEIEKQEEVIEAADNALSKLQETQETLKETFEKLNTELGELAKEAGDIEIKFDAEGAFGTIRGLRLELQGLKSEMSALGINPATGDAGEIPTIEEMVEVVESGQMG